MTNIEYTVINNDEKAAIVESTVRSLEYQMYQAELQMVVENARNNPDETRLQILTAEIQEKQKQIAAIKP
ncbi:MAG: hypothetical protein EBS86_09370 [Crocinitomicaceae bacterium]|jgi:hypothetical protein|nr:hypothetical protein [Crocinitomicaceae bacterium]